MAGHHDPFLDPPEARLAAAYRFRLAAGRTLAPASGAALRAFAGELGRRLAQAAAEQGWQADPPFPGADAGIERLGGILRLVLATRIRGASGALGVVFVTLLSGRAAEIAVAPPDTVTPLLEPGAPRRSSI